MRLSYLGCEELCLTGLRAALRIVPLRQPRHMAASAHVQPLGNPGQRHRRFVPQFKRRFHFLRIALAPVLVVGKNGLSPVAAIHHRINRPRILNADFSSHRRSLICPKRQSQPNMTTSLPDPNSWRARSNCPRPRYHQSDCRCCPSPGSDTPGQPATRLAAPGWSGWCTRRPQPGPPSCCRHPGRGCPAANNNPPKSSVCQRTLLGTTV